MRWLFAGILAVTFTACEQPDVRAPQTSVASKAVSKTLTAADRKARFDARDAAKIPSSLPSRWHDTLETLGAKPIAFSVKVSARFGSALADRHRRAHFRVFGLDKEVDERLHQHLIKLGLTGLKMPLADQDFASGGQGWTFEIDRVVAPPGLPRQTDVQITSYRRSQTPQNLVKCRRLKAVEPDEVVPRWLTSVTRVRSTRRCVSSDLNVNVEEVRVRLQMLYRNGYAHDENVGQIVKAAKKAGFAVVGGEGPNQRLRSKSGARLTLRSIIDGVELGCRPTGPLLEVEWSSPLTP